MKNAKRDRVAQPIYKQTDYQTIIAVISSPVVYKLSHMWMKLIKLLPYKVWYNAF